MNVFESVDSDSRLRYIASTRKSTNHPFGMAQRRTLRHRSDLQQHWAAIAGWAQNNGATATVEPQTLRLRVARGARGGTLYPTFVGMRDGRIFYTPELHTQALGFVGWLPYTDKSWPTARDKREFKEWAGSVGLRTPLTSESPALRSRAYLIKPRASSFGYGIRGPYPSWGGRDAGPLPAEGEYAEEFVLGDIARAYYWDGRLGVLELYAMPSVTGDGSRTIENLARARVRIDEELPTGFDELLALQDLHRGSVLTRTREAYIDYRYVSPLNPTAFENCNRLFELREGPIVAQFVRAGELAWRSIPEDLKPYAAFVLDAIVDKHGVAQLLEMNCLPQLHPDLYTFMLDGVFETRKSDG